MNLGGNLDVNLGGKTHNFATIRERNNNQIRLSRLDVDVHCTVYSTCQTMNCGQPFKIMPL